MKKMMHYLLIEWKLLFRGLSFWFLLLIIAGLFYLTTLNDYRVNDLGWYLSGMLYFYHSPLFLIAQFLGVAAARKDVTSRTYSIHSATPYRSSQVIGARLLSLIIPFSLFALIPAGFYMMRGLIQGFELATLFVGIAILCTYVVPMAFTIVLSYWVGTWTKKRINYLISFALILSLIIFARLLFSQFTPVHWVHLVDMGLTDLSSLRYYSELWGFTTDITFWMHRLFYIGLIFIVLGGIVGGMMQRRREKHGRMAIASLVGTAILVCIIAIVSYASVWQERTTAFAAQVDFYQQELVRENTLYIQQSVIEQFLLNDATENTVLMTDELGYEELQAVMQRGNMIGNPLSEQHKKDLLIGQQYSALQALSYDLELTTRANHKLEVQANMQLIHNLEQPFERFPVSLRHVFEVDSVKLNDVEVEFAWEPYKDVLWIETFELPPGKVFTLDLSYSGQINEWYLRKSSGAKDDHWERRVFIDDDKLFLPAFYGWYPMPGNKRLAEYETARFGQHNSQLSRLSHEIRENLAPHYPVDFNIVLNTPAQMSIASNGTELSYDVLGNMQRVVLAAEHSGGFNLIGGDVTLWTVNTKDESFSLVLSNQITNKKAEEITDNLLKHYEQLSSIIKTIDPDRRFSPRSTFIRAEYPGRFDRGLNELYELNLATYALGLNNTLFLPYSINLSNFRPFSQKSFNEHILNQTLFSSGEDAGSHHYVEFVSIITNYIDRTVYPSEGPLFDPWSHLESGKPSPLFLAINALYERTGHDAFLNIIPDMYHYVTDYYKDGFDFDAYVRFRDEFTIYINSLVGDAL